MTVVYIILLSLGSFCFGKFVGEEIIKKKFEEEISRLDGSYRVETRKLKRRIAELEKEREGGTHGDVG
jgi:hypothetical protein